MANDYVHGGMDVHAQVKTFQGFMNATVYGGGAIALMLLYPILVFAAGFSWLPSLVATIIVGIVYGMLLKLKGGWHASVIVFGLLTGGLTFLFSIFT